MVEEKNWTGTNALMLASEFGHTNVVERLLRESDFVNAINNKNSSGKNALFLAQNEYNINRWGSSKTCTGVIKLLIAAGAENVHVDSGRPPLRFNIGDLVQAFVGGRGGWKPGKIIRVWDHGNPYRIKLEDGTNVWGPEDIDKFVVPWSKTLPPMPVPPEGWKDEEHGHSHGHGHGGGHNELNNSGHGHSHGGVACDGNHGDEKKEKEEEDGHGHSHGGVACDDDGDSLAENDLHDVE